jgi:hypothetical protein
MATEPAGGDGSSLIGVEKIGVGAMIHLAYDKVIEDRAADLVESLREKGTDDLDIYVIAGFWLGVDWARHLLGTIARDSLDYMDDKGGETNGD